ncbi:hypothetical protein EDB92DRAFT_1895313 [Lactarius akahatsu]|uniref:Uncharacterized protein n=1 Tax=Lactarius akahatsu TaxID=416441 RepID=A0AAD4L821_9AGAM|nr:hypothetical protein EDB92DRAFT_1895313 [Lactarius akahatsu]
MPLHDYGPGLCIYVTGGDVWCLRPNALLTSACQQEAANRDYIATASLVRGASSRSPPAFTSVRSRSAAATSSRSCGHGTSGRSTARTNAGPQHDTQEPGRNCGHAGDRRGDGGRSARDGQPQVREGHGDLLVGALPHRAAPEGGVNQTGTGTGKYVRTRKPASCPRCKRFMYPGPTGSLENDKRGYCSDGVRSRPPDNTPLGCLPPWPQPNGVFSSDAWGTTFNPIPFLATLRDVYEKVVSGGG